MVVVKQFSTQFEVEFPVKLGYPLLYVLRLNTLIFLVVKSYFHTSFQKNGANLHKKSQLFESYFKKNIKKATRMIVLRNYSANFAPPKRKGARVVEEARLESV